MSGVSHLLTTSQAADKFNVSAKTILRWVELGWLPAVSIPSGRIRIPEDAIVTKPVTVKKQAAS